MARSELEVDKGIGRARVQMKRNRAKEDERVLIVTLTAEGEKLRDKAVEIPQKVGGCVCLDQEEAASLYKILYKILGNM